MSDNSSVQISPRTSLWLCFGLFLVFVLSVLNIDYIEQIFDFNILWNLGAVIWAVVLFWVLMVQRISEKGGGIQVGWYYKKWNKVIGPVGEDALVNARKAGKIHDGTPVRYYICDEWVRYDGLNAHKKYIEANKDKLLKKTIDQFLVGDYSGGLEAKPPIRSIICEVKPTRFLFKIQNGKEIGSIPRNSIKDISVETTKNMTQRLTVTRILTLGILSLAAPKKTVHTDSRLVIKWQNKKGDDKTAIFESSGEMSAVEHKLNSHKMKRVYRLKPDEKKCPYCAEIIKKEAKVCRFCKSKLG